MQYRHSDAYHTLYDLSGLSAAQHRVVPNDSRKKELLACWTEEERECIVSLVAQNDS